MGEHQVMTSPALSSTTQQNSHSRTIYLPLPPALLNIAACKTSVGIIPYSRNCVNLTKETACVQE